MLNQFMIANIVIIHKLFLIAGISCYYIKHLLKKQIKNILPYLLLMYKI